MGKSGISISDEVLISVEGQIKIGNFSMDFQDMDLSVAGAPITVIRGYDSRDRHVSGDFGYGWNISTCGVTITKSCDLSKDWRMTTSGYNYVFSPTRPHIVSVNWGNGKVEKFAMKAEGGGLGSIKTASFTFESMDGSKSKLIPTISTKSWWYENGYFFKMDEDWNDIPFNPDTWQLTRADGSKYLINCKNGILAYMDANGNLSSKTDALGNVTNYSYDKHGNMLELIDAEGNTVTNAYNSKGFVTSINAMGIDIMSVNYDENGNTSSTVDALGNEINYSYDSKGNLKSVTDEIGTYMNMTYDSQGNVISATNGTGTTAEFTYDGDGNCLSKTLTYTSDGVSKTVTENYTYDEAGNLVKIIDSDGNITSTEYNSMGKVSVATDEKGRQTSYDYDDLGNLVKITYADGTSESFTYDREGNNLTATDRLGRTVTMKYDKVGNLLAKTYPNGAVVSYAYDANYNLVSETSTSGGTTKYEYDKIGRNTAIIDALGNRTGFAYNSHSQLESMTDAKDNVHTYTYDDNGNRIKTTYPDGSSVSSAYDARGRVTSQKDQHGYTTAYTYDGGDRLTSVTDALGNVTNYTYDEVGNLIMVTDAKGNSTYYTYDDFGRVIRTTNALGKTAEVTYDISGNVLTSTDFAGKLTSYTYDEFDRISSKTTDDGTVTYSYTVDGKLSSVKDSTGTTKYTYDSMDGLKKVVYPNGEYVEYSYDDSCRLTNVKTAYGTTKYEWDKLDRLIRVVDRNGYATVYEYDENGNRSAVRYANGIVISYKYDEVNRLISEKALDKQGGLVAQYEYTLGAAGERTKVKELDRTVEYTYDALYRLTGEKITAADKTVTEYTYAYDKVSNRILKTENGTKTTYTYNALNQLVKENDTVYKYDDAGNLISTTSSGKSVAYTYNAENKLIRATVNEAGKTVVEEYTYDYAGNRTSKTTGSETVKYLNDNSVLTNVLAEFDANGNELCYYTIGADLISQERNGKTSLYLYDGHGSVRGLIDENGKVTDTYNYDAFGNLLDKTGTTVNNYLYCGEQFDSATGLYYLRARYMNPATGTFITQDTYSGTIFDPVSLHKYLYANANPVMNVDPSGYSAENDLDFYQQAWITIDQAIEYEHKLLGSMSNEVSYDYNVMQIGREILHQLKNTGLEYAITYALEPYVGPDIARLIANGVVSALDIATSARSKAIGDSSGIVDGNSIQKKTPAQRAADKGYPGIGTTSNGGPDFKGSGYVYIDSNGKETIVTIKMTGSRGKDDTLAFDNANIPRNERKGIKENYTWHHIDDFDPQTGTCTIQLVLKGAHVATYPHKGAVSQYENYHGVKYK